MKKRFWIFLVFFYILYGLTGCSHEEKDQNKVNEEEGTKKIQEQTISADDINQSSMDIVLMIDKSGSMVKSDKERKAIMGAKMFLDMMPKNGASAAIVDFASKADSTDMTEVGNEKNITYLKKYLDNIAYDSGVTDYGLALKNAVKLLDETKGNNQKAILFFTDGNLNTGKKRKLSEAEKDVEDAINISAKKGYKIFSLGLDDNEKVNELQLSKIAADTDGEYKIIHKAEELQKAFEEIFKEIGRTEGKEIGTVRGKGTLSFEIDDNNVMEANILMLSSAKVKEVSLTKPDGKKANLKGEKYTFTAEEGYSILKIREPESGTWKISVKGIKKDKISVQLLYNYDLSIQADAVVDKVQKGGTITITSSLYNTSGVIEDQKFYDNKTAITEITCKNKEGETSIDKIAMDANENGYVSEYKIPQTGVYTVKVKITGKGWDRESSQIRIDVQPMPIKETKKLKQISVNKGSEKKFDLSEYFADEEQSQLNYTIDSVDNDQKGIEETVSGSVMTVKAKTVGHEIVHLTVINEQGAQLAAKIRITGETFLTKYGLILLAALFVIILIIIFIIYSYLRKKMVGEMHVSIMITKRDDDTGIPKSSEYSIFNNSFRCRVLGEHGFTAQQLLALFTQSYLADAIDAQKKEDYRIAAEQANHNLKEVVFKPASRKGIFFVKTKNKNIVILDSNGMGQNRERKIQVGRGEAVSFDIKVKINGGMDQGGEDFIMHVGAARD